MLDWAHTVWKDPVDALLFQKLYRISIIISNTQIK